jgi:hypothetical protein
MGEQKMFMQLKYLLSVENKKWLECGNTRIILQIHGERMSQRMG